MEALRQYVISVTTAAIICGIILTLCPKGSVQGFLKLLCGVFLTVAVIYPLTRMDLQQWISEFSMSYDLEGEAAAAFGEDTAQDSLGQRIKEQTEAYILDKAAAMGASLEVEVEISDGDPPVPVSVTIYGSVSPYARQQLKKLITEDLGISKENQRWTG